MVSVKLTGIIGEVAYVVDPSKILKLDVEPGTRIRFNGTKHVVAHSPTEVGGGTVISSDLDAVKLTGELR
jgi:uncharacterized protein YlzI (FlbEa/FlbD family)